MTEETIRRVYEFSDLRIREAEKGFHRYLFQNIDWDERLIALDGPRGTGKTTMLLQFLGENPERMNDSLYISVDDTWLEPLEIFDLAGYHVQHGGTRLFIDEIHYLESWQNLVKNIHDTFKGLNVAYTGSSILRLASGKADLSRRQLGYSLKGMSFREFLKLEGALDQETIPLESILVDHVQIATEISRKVKIIPLFEQYLRHGYYPFYREDTRHFGERLRQVVNQILDSDMPLVDDVTPETIRKARRMLGILAESTPQTPNITALCRGISMDRKQGLKVLYALMHSGLLGLLVEDADKLKELASPSKIFCDNTNLMYALVPSPDKGTLREAFFNNQISVGHTAVYPRRGDFLVDNRYLFEVGGAGKRFEQIKDIPESYLAVDETEVGRGNKIPLWLFGFLY